MDYILIESTERKYFFFMIRCSQTHYPLKRYQVVQYVFNTAFSGLKYDAVVVFLLEQNTFALCYYRMLLSILIVQKIYIPSAFVSSV